MHTEHEEAVIRYYGRPESAIGYRLFLGGARHVCYYPLGVRAWRLHKALRELEDLVGRELELPPNSLVLDAGCGLGQVALRLAERFQLDVTGVDLLNSNVLGARRRTKRSTAAARLRFYEMSYAALDFPDESFDGVYTIESLVHAEDLRVVLKELHRVLRVGGRAVFLEFSRAPDEELSEQARASFSALNALDEMPGFQEITHATFQELLDDLGFSRIRNTNIIEQIYPMLRLFATIGLIPSAIGRVLHINKLMVSSLSAINIWKFREELAYNIVVAEKRAT